MFEAISYILIFFIITFSLFFFNKSWQSYKKRNGNSSDINYFTLLQKKSEERDRNVRKDLHLNLHKKVYYGEYPVLGSDSSVSEKKKEKPIESSPDNLFRMFD